MFQQRSYIKGSLLFLGMGKCWQPAILLTRAWLWFIAVIWKLQQIYKQLCQVSVSSSVLYLFCHRFVVLHPIHKNTCINPTLRQLKYSKTQTWKNSFKKLRVSAEKASAYFYLFLLVSSMLLHRRCSSNA